MKHALIPVLLLLAACSTVLPKQLGETDAEFEQRKHEAKVADVNRAFLLVDTAMNLAKSQGAGDEEFWLKYDDAKTEFNMVFAAWKAGSAADGDTIDKLMAALNALSAELAAMDDAPSD